MGQLVFFVTLKEFFIVLQVPYRFWKCFVAGKVPVQSYNSGFNIMSSRHLRLQSQQWKHQSNGVKWSNGVICSKLTIKTPERRHWRRSGVFSLTLNRFHTMLDFEQVCWVTSMNIVSLFQILSTNTCSK